MIELSRELITVLLIGGILIGVFSGIPIALVMGTLALVFGYIVFGSVVPHTLYSRIVGGILLNYPFLAVPLFIYMGGMLERSGIAGRLFDAFYVWLGGLRGGLALLTTLIGTIMAATVGIIAASVSSLAVVALPAMIKRGYSKCLASGTVCAAGCLGILIPPSIMLVIYGPMAQISVGKLFMGAFGPGFLLSALYMSYIGVTSFLNPEIAPSVPHSELAQIPLSKKMTMLLSSMIPPVILILSVLGVIFLGIAAPTEAAGIGALAATLLVIAYRRFSLKVLRDVSLETLKTCGFVNLIVVLGFAFVGVFIGSGAGDVLTQFIMLTPGGKWVIFCVIMFMIFIMGFFLDFIAIIFILVPVVTPLASKLGFDPLWFAIMVCVNFQTAFLTPPLAMAIFIVKGVAPKELNLTMADIIRGVVPFVVLILIGMALCIAFPEIILWLPGKMIK